jgi:hypothetical protein
LAIRLDFLAKIVYFYGEQSIVSTESSAVSTEDDKQSFLNVIASNVGIVAIVVVAAVVVAGSSGNGDDGDDDNGDDADDDGDGDNKLSFTTALDSVETIDCSP